MAKNGKIQVSKFFARRTEAPSDAVWTVLAAVVCAGAAAAQPTSPPNLSPDNVTGWVPLNYGDSFVSPADGPGPVVDDPRYPFVSNQTSARTGKRSTFHIADLNNPILQPWAKEELRKRNEWILSGKPGYSVQVSCIPLGVPAFVLHPVQPLYFIGHYEGDTLVVDTIGINDKTYIDNFRTPHTEKLHVVERFRMIDDGNILEANIRIEDPGAFVMPWNAVQRWRRVQQGPMYERVCAENPFDLHIQDTEPVPHADTPDF